MEDYPVAEFIGFLTNFLLNDPIPNLHPREDKFHAVNQGQGLPTSCLNSILLRRNKSRFINVVLLSSIKTVFINPTEFLHGG